MNEVINELKAIASKLTSYRESFRARTFVKQLDQLRQAAEEVGKSWSGSWLGYQSCVYYNNFMPPPPGHHFDRTWGLHGPFARGSGLWTELTSDQVEQEIHRRAGNPNLTAARKKSAEGAALFAQNKESLLSILHALAARSSQPFLQKLVDEATITVLPTKESLLEYVRPGGSFTTADRTAVSQGLRVPPHISVLADVGEIEGPPLCCDQLAAVARKAFSYLERMERSLRRDARIGTNIFIGHGGSKAWKELKDFLQDRLRLPWDEFNRIPVAGTTNIARLSEMLDAAAIAFIIMTAEDEQKDGTTRARMNVIHEAGLFQGRLGFSRAIVLLEEGCEEFSNIEGLGQIRFPRGNISASFEEIRRVLEREGLIAEK